MNGTMLCSVLSSSCAFFRISAACARGTTATPSSSATMMSFGVHSRARAGDRNIHARESIMIDRGGRHDAAAEDRELQPLDLRQVAHEAVHHRAREAAILHGRGHQAADAGDIQSRLRAPSRRPSRRGRVSMASSIPCEAAEPSWCSSFFMQHGDGGPGKLGGESGRMSCDMKIRWP